ncbi:MAG: flagellar motor switch protein FliN [Pirellulaceae bacterium]
MADDSHVIGQNEIEELLKQARGAAQPAPPPPAAAATPTDGPVRQDEIDALLQGMAGPTRASAAKSTSSVAVETGSSGGSGAASPLAGTPSTTGDDVQFLLEQAEAALASVDRPSAAMPDLTPFPLRNFTGSPASQERATLDALSDVELDLKIELGRTHMHLEEVLKLRRGSVVALDKLAGDPVDVYVNGRLIARGEVLVLNDNFCVRVAELVAGDDTH